MSSPENEIENVIEYEKLMTVIDIVCYNVYVNVYVLVNVILPENILENVSDAVNVFENVSDAVICVSWWKTFINCRSFDHIQCRKCIAFICFRGHNWIGWNICKNIRSKSWWWFAIKINAFRILTNA